MGNRVMAAKAMKLRRQIRNAPRPMSGGQVPNRGILQEYKERAKGLAVNEAEIDEAIRHFYNREPWHGVTPERLAVFETLDDLKRMVPEMLFFDIIPENTQQRLRCFFNSTKTCFVLEWTRYRKGVVLRSIEYPSRQAVVRSWDSDRTIWVETRPRIKE